jgi:hypothetical protein
VGRLSDPLVNVAKRTHTQMPTFMTGRGREREIERVRERE